MNYCDAIKEGFFYHYTSLSSLAMILRYKTLRLYPLSGMDDIQEQFASDSKEYGRYVYVSSWTKADTEIISMWRMYCKEREGVRIGLRANPFKVFDFESRDFVEVSGIMQGECVELGEKLPFLHVVDICHDDYIVRNSMYGCQLFEVAYSDELKDINPQVVYKDRQNLVLDGRKMGLTKNKYWEFQQEVRYKIVIGDLELERQIIYNHQNKDPDELMLERLGILPEYIDLHLSDKAIEEMEIVLSPDFDDANRILLEALVDIYNPKSIIRESKLKGLIR